MPSLSALGEFRDSFGNIGGERAALMTKKLPVDDLDLPENEAPPFVPLSYDNSAAEDALFSNETFLSKFENVLFEPQPEEPGIQVDDGDNLDFSAFLDTIPEDISPPPVDDVDSDFDIPTDDPSDIEAFSPDTDVEVESEQFDAQDIEEPEDALDLGGENIDGSFTSDSVSFEGLDTAEEDSLDGSQTDIESENLDLDLGDFNLDAKSAESGLDFDSMDPGSELPDTSDESFAAETESVFDGMDLGSDLPDISDENLDLGGESSGDFDIMGDIPQTESPEETMEIAAGDAGEPPEPDSDSLDLGGEEAFQSGDSFDSFDLGGETGGGEAIDLESESPSTEGDDFGGTDFTLPGIDDLFKKPPKGEETIPAAITWDGETKTDDVEEIRLSEDELNSLQKTLSGYPLNLRIACQELIAEHVLAPDQLSKLIRLLVGGAPAKEAAAMAGSILGKTIVIPRGFEKSTGEALEAEQASFAYIFVHNFLPVLRLFAIIAVSAACVFYLGYKFVYNPLRAEAIYKRGYERIFAGEYQRADDLFGDAFRIYRNKKWFYRYAEGFRDERRYMLAENKYDELLRYYPRNKKGVLDYADLETNYLLNYAKAERLLQQELLDYAPNDAEGLLALGDNYLAWADSNPSRFGDKYEDARYAYSRLLDRYGWKAPVVERMMIYFIRTDNLKEVLHTKAWFDENKKRLLSAVTLAELGGYFLDKQLQEVRGVPDEYIESIEGVRALLLQAVREEPSLPEPHYHLARYYGNLDNTYEERLTLENAIRAFDAAREESVRRRVYRIDTHRRYADLLINNREFFPAEEQLVRGINLYEEFLSRNLVAASPEYGRLYAGLGDLEYFVKSGNMEMALNYYHRSEQNGWAPPEIQYRMGAAYYQLEDWRNALEYLFMASAELPLNRRMLFALGNAALKRGDYFAAQGYYNRLLDILENQRTRLPVLLPNDRPEFLELGERIMMARNNAGVAYEALARQTGNRNYRSRALALYAESARAWDSITRNPTTMVRLNPSGEFGSPGVNLGYLNANNALRPASTYEPEIFIRIDRDVLEPSPWDRLLP
ncbi:MAG: tetratricopeptide repeat protein [Treponema sp.]|nr:tetratricopeptide repeat protein [Treponema sp.]